MKCPYCGHDLGLDEIQERIARRRGGTQCRWCGRYIKLKDVEPTEGQDDEEELISKIENGTCTFPAVTMEYLPGYEIVKVIGPVYGLTVRARGFGGQLEASVQTLFGGEITAFASECIKARNESLARIILHAKKLGANAVLKVDFETSGTPAITIFSAYGTAVTVKPIDKEIS